MLVKYLSLSALALPIALVAAQADDLQDLGYDIIREQEKQERQERKEQQEKTALERITHAIKMEAEYGEDWHYILNGMEDGPAQSMDRTVTQNDMDLVNNYGCWCYFEENHGSGRGKPVDEIDTLCKRLHDGYTCAIMDSQDLVSGPCNPWRISYNSAVGTGMVKDMDIATIRSECDVQNPANGCANWVCKIEGYFVQQLVLYFTSGGLIDHSMRHENGFDPKGDCPTSSGIDSEKACCDDYPLRFPFKTYNGSRDCCYSHTFNTNLYQCCADGKVKLSC